MFKTKDLWTEDSMRPLLDAAGLLDIESVSQREFDWFETPNRRRGGWSGVSRIVLNPNAPTAEQQAVFLKIQQNHFYRSRHTFFRKQLTYQREFDALKQLKSLTKQVTQVILFAEWSENNNRGCILISNALDEWESMDKWLQQSPPQIEIQRVLTKLAETLRPMHQARWAHFGLFQKHIFLHNPASSSLDLKLIDLEKARRPLTVKQCVIEDVSRFLRHSTNLDSQLQIYFLKAYFQVETFTTAQIAWIRKMRGAPKV